MATKVGLFTTKLYAVNIASNGVSSSLLRCTNTLFGMPYLYRNSVLYRGGARGVGGTVGPLGFLKKNILEVGIL